MSVAQLIVRNLDAELVRELKMRAAREGHSAEEEHRRILQEALKPGQRSESLKRLLSRMPEGGEDGDFDRSDDRGRPVEL